MKNDSSYFFSFKKINYLNEYMCQDIRAAHKLKQIDINLLFYLHCEDADTANKIQQTTGISKGHISQSVERLQNMGLISSYRDEKDHRCIHLKPTEEADKILVKITDNWKNMIQLLIKDIPQEDLAVLKRTLCQINKCIDEQVEGFSKG